MVTWKRFAYVETGGNADVMTISSIPTTAKYIRLIIEIKRNGTMDNVSFRFNDDDDDNYSWQYNKNGDETSAQGDYNYLRFWYQGAADGFAIVDIININGKEKMVMSNACMQESNNECKNTQMVGKWIESELINKITIHEFHGSNTFGDGTSVTVLIRDEGTTVYDYPDLKNGATFLTRDTNKLYMWDGTDTWNEVS